MEKAPQIRAIGNASVEEKEKAKDNLHDLLFSHFESLKPEEVDELKKLEYPKSETEIACINFANKKTDELMQEAWVAPYDIPVQNFHIIPPELFKKISNSDDASATTYTTQQGIIFDARLFRANPVYFGAVAIHEALHLKAHLSLEVNKDEEGVDVTHYRKGVTIQALQKHGYNGEYHQHFEGLHEAIVATQEKKTFGELLELPELSDEKSWLSSEKAQKIRRELAQKKGIPEDDFIWVGEEKNDWETISYKTQREVLDYVCSEIQKQFSDTYKDTDEVFREFLKSNFTGRLLPIARLVEKTFGEGSFRLLGNMETEKSSGVLHLESLKKARMRQVRDAGV